MFVLHEESTYMQVDEARQNALRLKMEGFMALKGRGDVFEMVQKKYLEVG